MANYHFHFQQQEEGHREDVRPPAPLVPLVSPYISTLHEESSFHGFQHRVRPTQAPHIATLAARPSRPHRRRQSVRSRSTSTCRSRSRRRRRTRRSRSSSPRSHRRRARSRSPSQRSRASRATRTTATQMSPTSSAFYPENPQYPAAAFSAPPSTLVVPETVASAKASPEVVPAVLSPCHPRPHLKLHLTPKPNFRAFVRIYSIIVQRNWLFDVYSSLSLTLYKYRSVSCPAANRVL